MILVQTLHGAEREGQHVYGERLKRVIWEKRSTGFNEWLVVQGSSQKPRKDFRKSPSFPRTLKKAVLFCQKSSG